MSARAAHWLTIGEIVQMDLPGMPNCRRRLLDQIVAEGWASRVSPEGMPLARKRRARGGGTEYHVSLLPGDAQAQLRLRELAAEAAAIAANDTGETAVDAWNWYERQSTKAKEKAGRRMAILMDIEARIEDGVGRTAATQEIASAHGVSPRAVAEWYALVRSKTRGDWLPYLVPQHKGSGNGVEIDPACWQLLKSKYLTNSRQPFAAAYNEVLEEYAIPNGIQLPCLRTLKRRMDKESLLLRKGKREGMDAVKRSVPPLKRSVAQLHAMEAVNIDGHVCDVWVDFGLDPKGNSIIARPVLVGIQDIYSRKILAHRIGRSENTRLVKYTFADLFRDWGIPDKATLDNGRAFASKAVTGGAKTRYRYSIKADEQLGILTQLGVKTHWTMPYSGRSKPIERAWKQLCDYAAKSFPMVGAYTGNKPDAKPENYRSRAIPIAAFEAHVSQVINRHNARPGRTTETARGRSFDATFEASYSMASIKGATEEQLRIALLEEQERRCHRDHGAITILRNEYHADALRELAGQKVKVKYDPDNLHSAVHVYRMTGEYVCAAPVTEATGFYDTAGAERQRKAQSKVRKTFREYEDAANLLTEAQMAELLRDQLEPSAKPAPGATRLVQSSRHVATALKPAAQAAPQTTEPTFIDSFVAGAARLRGVE